MDQINKKGMSPNLLKRLFLRDEQLDFGYRDKGLFLKQFHIRKNQSKGIRDNNQESYIQKLVAPRKRKPLVTCILAKIIPTIIVIVPSKNKGPGCKFLK